MLCRRFAAGVPDSQPRVAEESTVESPELRARRMWAEQISASVGRVSWRGLLLGRWGLGEREPGAYATRLSYFAASRLLEREHWGTFSQGGAEVRGIHLG
jgi:hypothetical protein